MIVVNCGSAESGILSNEEIAEFERCVKASFGNEEVIAVPYWLKYSENRIFHYGDEKLGWLPSDVEIEEWKTKLAKRGHGRWLFLPYFVKTATYYT